MSQVILSVKNKVMDTTVTKMTCPFKGYDNHLHKGIDLIPKSTDETPYVLAYDSGTVIGTGNVQGTNKSTGTLGCGTYVILKHDNGAYTRYQHLKYNSVKVVKGQKVAKGQVLALYGRPTTGNSTGPHLHFDISFPTKVNSNCLTGTWAGETRYYVDPRPYLEGKTTTAQKTMAVKVNTTLNVRSSPNGAIVGKLKNGDKVTVSEVKDGWAKIGSGKWVSADYLIEK